MSILCLLTHHYVFIYFFQLLRFYYVFVAIVCFALSSDSWNFFARVLFTKKKKEITRNISYKQFYVTEYYLTSTLYIVQTKKFDFFLFALIVVLFTNLECLSIGFEILRYNILSISAHTCTSHLEKKIFFHLKKK